ncbi:MAG: hypothetical protein U9O24_09485 [Campylobacterota bacterium]|nr:hypothetical protein [Campylobacterota bacterium]
MNKIKKIILSTLLLFIPSLLLATTSENSSTSSPKKNSLAVFYTLEGNIEDKFNTIVEKQLKSVGFNITDPHKRVNDQYKKRYGSTVLDVLSFMSVVNDDNVLPLLNLDPRIAAFSPFNMLIHKRLDEKNTHVGHLMPEAMLDMIGIEDPKIRAEFTAAFKPLDEMLEKELSAGGVKVTKSYMPYKKLAKNRMINYEFEFEAPEDMDDFIDEFQNDFELAFIDKKYLIAGYHNFLDGSDDAEEILSDYAAFWTYSLCHLEFSYNMFDNKGAHPEAGLFAPCSMYMYIKKGTNKVVIGMPTLVNWSDTLGVTDQKRVGLVHKLDKEIPQILSAMGMKAMPNVNPLTIVETKKVTKVVTPAPAKKIVKPDAPKAAITNEKKIQKIKANGKIINIVIPKPPKVPTPVTVNTINGSGIDTSRSIKFSKRVPPNYVPSHLRKKEVVPVNTNTDIGKVTNGKIAAYLRGKFMDVKTAKATLKKAGFDIVAVTPVNKKGDLISIVFTDSNIEKMASKPNRGFAASLRLLVNIKDKHISITNPLYMAKAFMQKTFDEKIAKTTLVKITSTFTGLLNSKDTLKFQLLPKYQFMNGMPHYEDMTVVARGNNLLEKIKNNKKVLFIQKLENGSTLIGVKLGKRTQKFTARIGTNNAGLLPYPLLIENGEAKILEPKYYISIMYPLLKMSEFMTIATVPGAIIKDCEKVFK